MMALVMCTTLVFIALAAAAQLVLRRRPADGVVFTAPGSPGTSVLFVLLLGAVVALVAVSRPLQALAGAALVLLGIPAYEIAGKATRIPNR
jgi:hypothetical protein